MSTQLHDVGLPDLFGQPEFSSRPTDLYWWWHHTTSYAALSPAYGGLTPYRLAFIAEGDVEAFAEELGNHVEIPALYRRPLREGGSTAPRYFTFSIRTQAAASTDVATRDPDWQAIVAVMRKVRASQHIYRAQFGFDRGSLAEEEGGRLGRSFQLGRQDQDDVHGASDHVAKVRRVSTPIEAEVVLGVIDDGAVFAHRTLLTSTRQANGRESASSRIVVVWNQTQQLNYLNEEYWVAANNWQRVDKAEGAGGLYGAVLQLHYIEQILSKELSTARTFGEIDELRAYRRLVSDIGSDAKLVRREVHGAAVVTTFAGNENAAGALAGDSPTLKEIGQSLTDKAASAPIIFVDLPYEKLPISSGRWMPMCALDGIQFIRQAARMMFVRRCDHSQVPVVVNLSTGSNTGPHDGSSIIESAISEMLCADDQLAVVLAAGNARLANVFASKVIQPASHIDKPSEGTFYFRLPPYKKFESYIEFWPRWLSESGEELASEARSLTIVARGPDGTIVEARVDEFGSAAQVRVPEPTSKRSARRPTVGLAYTSNAVQSRDRPMGLLVLGASNRHEELHSASPGVWSVTIRSTSPHRVAIDARIERDEIVYGIRRPQSVHFVDDPDPRAQVLSWHEETGTELRRDETRSNMAGAKGAFVAAAGVGSEQRGFASPYSGSGRLNKEGERPAFIARADRSPVQWGVPVWGSYANARWHMSGTSIAAPQVARFVANLMANGYSRSAITCLTSEAYPRTHPHLEVGQVAASEGRWFVSSPDKWAPFEDLGSCRR